MTIPNKLHLINLESTTKGLSMNFGINPKYRKTSDQRKKEENEGKEKEKSKQTKRKKKAAARSAKTERERRKKGK